MNGKEELREVIEANNKRIGELLNKFVLTSEIGELMEQNVILRQECATKFGHEFENGVCKWCGAKEHEEW